MSVRVYSETELSKIYKNPTFQSLTEPQIKTATLWGAWAFVKYKEFIVKCDAQKDADGLPVWAIIGTKNKGFAMEVGQQLFFVTKPKTRRKEY
jgi:hypothetical protein